MWWLALSLLLSSTSSVGNWRKREAEGCKGLRKRVWIEPWRGGFPHPHGALRRNNRWPLNLANVSTPARPSQLKKKKKIQLKNKIRDKIQRENKALLFIHLCVLTPSFHTCFLLFFFFLFKYRCSVPSFSSYPHMGWGATIWTCWPWWSRTYNQRHQAGEGGDKQKQKTNKQKGGLLF